MLSVEKEAIPAEAVTLVVPESVPPLGLVPIATVTLFVAVVTVFPNVSCTATCTAGEIVSPPLVLLGCTLKPSLEAAPKVMLNDPLVAPVRVPADAVKV